MLALQAPFVGEIERGVKGIEDTSDQRSARDEIALQHLAEAGQRILGQPDVRLIRVILVAGFEALLDLADMT
jgi:hypothetical protein